MSLQNLVVIFSVVLLFLSKTDAKESIDNDILTDMHTALVNIWVCKCVHLIGFLIVSQ